MSTLTNNRWAVLIGSLGIQAALGLLYAWSVFAGTLKSVHHWSPTQAMTAFAIEIAAFALAMLIASRVTGGRVSPRLQTIIGGLLLGIGYVSAGIFAGDFTVTTAAFALIGVGSGLAYTTPIAAAIKAFPNHKGLVTGVTVGCFALGSLAWGKLAGTWGGLLATYGIGSVFVGYGLVAAAMVVIGSLVLSPVAAAAVQGDSIGALASRSDFRKLWILLMLNSAAGLTAIGSMSAFAVASGISKAQAELAVLIVLPIANALGRVGWGAVSDRIGRIPALTLLTWILSLAVMSVPVLISSNAGVVALAALIGFNYGGNFALFPAITAERFGVAKVGPNYAVVFSAFGLAGVAGPLLVTYAVEHDALRAAFLIGGIVILIGSAVAHSIRR